MADLKAQANAETDPAKKQALLDEAGTWDEGGRYRVLLHTLAGALNGGVGGALGAGISQATIDEIGKQIAQTDLPIALKETLAAAIGTAIGAAVGGTSGAISGFTDTVNNYLTVADLQKPGQSVKERQTTGVKNSAIIENACFSSAQSCVSTITSPQPTLVICELTKKTFRDNKRKPLTATSRRTWVIRSGWWTTRSHRPTTPSVLVL